MNKQEWSWRRRDGIQPIRHKPHYTVTLSFATSESGHTAYAFVSEVQERGRPPFVTEWAWSPPSFELTMLQDVRDLLLACLYGAMEDLFGLGEESPD